MHRESARDNPQVPLTHHDLDSTHISEGVLRAGVETGPMTFEASVFRGEEPTGRQPLQHRDAGARLVGGAGRLASRPVARAVVGRAAAQPGMVRARTRRRRSPPRWSSTARSRRVRSPRRWRGATTARTTATTITPTAICSNGICAPPAAPRSTGAWRTRPSRSSASGLHPPAVQPPARLLAHQPFTLGRCATCRSRERGRFGIGADFTRLSHVADLDRVLRRLAIVSRLPALASGRATVAHVH